MFVTLARFLYILRENGTRDMTDKRITELAIAINAGGKSARMGTDKSFVPLNGKPMIEHILAQIALLESDVTFVITNRPAEYAHLNLPLVEDVMPGKGTLGGIYTALHHSSSAYTLVLGCDMPFVNIDLLRYMVSLRDESGGPYDVIVPRHNHHPQGLHAVYRKTCLAPIQAQLAADRLKVIGFYEDVRVRYIDPAEWEAIDPRGLSFFNVNTPEDVQIAQELARTFSAD